MQAEEERLSGAKTISLSEAKKELERRAENCKTAIFSCKD